MKMRWGLMLIALLLATALSAATGAATALYIVNNSSMVQAATGDGEAVKDGETVESGASPAVPLPVPTNALYFPPVDDFQEEHPLIIEAKKYLGVPYLFGGEYLRDDRFDCSSYVQWIFAKFEIYLPRTTFDQVRIGIPISKSELLPGDLVFFENTSSIQTGVTHVGIYMGGGDFIHSAYQTNGVAITSLADDFYTAHWHSARRILLNP